MASHIFKSNRPLVTESIGLGAIKKLPLNPLSVAILAAGFCQMGAAQSVQTLDPITVSSRADDSQLSPLGDVPLSQSPLSATSFDAARLRAAGVTRLSELSKLDASITDAYNTVGYWDYATIRGYVLDNRNNFRREGLGINAETAISLFNKERVEVLKGASGISAGVSSPAGLINYRVKRPVDRLRVVDLSLDSFGARSVALDISERFAPNAVGQNTLGLRVNAAVDQLVGPQPGTRGSGRHFALAGAWQLSPATSLDLETEASRRSQPSVPGQSLWGNKLPVADARANQNQQPWSLPVELSGATTSLRLKHALGSDWQLQAQMQTQSLTSQDRVAFPFGCTEPSGAYYADRYCPDGNADLYDFRSENETRNTRAWQLSLKGQARLGGLMHRVQASLSRSSHVARFQDQAFNYVGTTSSVAAQALPADASLTDVNTHRDETSRELSLADAVSLNAATTAWLGLRSTTIQRASVRTNGSRPTQYQQSFTSPWWAISHRLSEANTVYLSRSCGIETDVAPNRSRFTNAGQSLPALQSKQTEVGIKHSGAVTQLTAAWFSIRRPIAADIGTCAGTRDCTRTPDGDAVHTGLELSAQARLSASHGVWRLNGSAGVIRARREGSVQVGINGLAPTNVPTHTLRVGAGFTPKADPRWTLDASASSEGERQVLPDNSIQLPGWTRVDASARLNWSANTQLSIGVDNAFNKRGFRESPYQFGHAYLFPIAPRSLKIGLSVSG